LGLNGGLGPIILRAFHGAGGVRNRSRWGMSRLQEQPASFSLPSRGCAIPAKDRERDGRAPEGVIDFFPARGRSNPGDPQRVISCMSNKHEELRLRMEAAADALDFEEASRLRDQLSLLRGTPDVEGSGDFDTSRLVRQQPGAMGLGTSDQKMTPPPGWKPPKKPDLLTSGHKSTRRRR